MDAPANGIRGMLKVPGLYRLMPRIWKKMVLKMFIEDAGFHFYPTDSHQVKFDMPECHCQWICHELDCRNTAACREYQQKSTIPTGMVLF